MNDVLSDMSSRIRNAQLRSNLFVNVLFSKLTVRVLDVMLRSGYIAGYDHLDDRILVRLKYLKIGVPVIGEIIKVSKPGRKVYCSLRNLSSIVKGSRLVILSTSKGVMSSVDAFANKTGGEVLFKVF